MITVVTHLWRQPGYHTRFEPAHVDALFRGVCRHYSGRFRFVVVVDAAHSGEKFQLGVEPYLVPPGAEARVPNPSIRGGPSCYRRLRLFDPEFQRAIGVDANDPIVGLDLDTVVLGDLGPLWDRPDDLVLWRDPLFDKVRYNGSMLLLAAGAHSDVWSRFDPRRSPRATRAAQMLGTDQAWLSYVLGDGVPTWGRRDGVYSYRLMTELKLRPGLYTEKSPRRTPPRTARIVFFHGRENPWDPAVQDRHLWVRENWG